MKFVWIVCGCTCVGLGAIGAVLPLLPTVPFMLLAAFCFARSSEKLHNWLINHKVFGPSIQDWHANGAISRPVKRVATLSIAAAFALSVILGVRIEILALQVTVLCAVALFIWTRPEA